MLYRGIVKKLSCFSRFILVKPERKWFFVSFFICLMASAPSSYGQEAKLRIHDSESWIVVNYAVMFDECRKARLTNPPVEPGYSAVDEIKKLPVVQNPDISKYPEAATKLRNQIFQTIERMQTAVNSNKASINQQDCDQAVELWPKNFRQFVLEISPVPELVSAADKGDVQAQTELANRYNCAGANDNNCSASFMWQYILAAEGIERMQFAIRAYEMYDSHGVRMWPQGSLQEGKRLADEWFKQHQSK
jgi:hypothetical protein